MEMINDFFFASLFPILQKKGEKSLPIMNILIERERERQKVRENSNSQKVL